MMKDDDFKLLRGFADRGRTDGRTLVIVESLLQLKVGYNLSIYVHISIFDSPFTWNDSSFTNCYKYSHNLIYIHCV